MTELTYEHVQVLVNAAQEISALRARNEMLEAALIEATAELIYLRQYGKDGAVWWANENKDVWRGKATALLALPPKPSSEPFP